MNSNDDIYFRFDKTILQALNHELRRKILLEIYQNGMGGYSELSQILKIKSGSFYHHVRILEQSQLIQQLEDKTYDLTNIGAKTIEYLLDEKDFKARAEVPQIFSLFNPLFELLSYKKYLTFLSIASLLVVSIIYLNLTHNIGIIGIFIIRQENISNLFITSTGLIIINLLIFFIYITYFYKRKVPKITIINHLLFPYLLLPFSLVILNFIPFFSENSLYFTNLGFILSFIFQIFSITYYLHVMRRLKIRSLERYIILFLLVNYSNLLIIFLFF